MLIAEITTWDLLQVLALAAAIFAVGQGVSSILSFQRNLKIAKASGLNYICRPMFEYNYFYIIVQPVVEKLVDLVPRGWDPNSYLDFFRKDWRMHCKFEKHQRYGNVYWNVSPRYLMLEIGDADVLEEVTRRRQDFVKPRWVFENVQLFGETILESEGEQWRRHRKVIGPRYNEDLNNHVWNHAAQLTAQMFPEWLSRSAEANKYTKGKTSDEMIGLGRLALYIIVGAAFGVSIPFSQDNVTLSPEVAKAVSFAEALHYTIQHLITCMIFPTWILHLGPAHWRKLAKATDEVRSYMRSGLMDEVNTLKGEAADRKSGGTTIERHGVITGIAEALAPEGTKPGRDQLEFQEGMGNIFLMGLAGSATTADTTHFAMVLLALHQDVQAWVVEEMDEVIAEFGDNWDYKLVFSRLTRVRACMMETLRLYPVSPVLAKWTQDRAQTLTYDGHTIHVPEGTVTVLSFPAVHYNPQYWGSDAAEWRPQRWDKFTPYEGSFAPFSKGARSCLGKRFSESEFTSVVSHVLRTHCVELQVDTAAGETLESCRQRTQKALDGAKTYLTLYVSDDVPLVWKKR